MTIIPLKDSGQLPEHGRIRTGIQNGKHPKALDTFRLTSVDRAALEALAEIYGGTVVPWHNAKANPPHQFEVITTSDTLQVAATPTAIHTAYELWLARGMTRQCDGETATCWEYDGHEKSTEEVPCICLAQGVVECKPKTRMQLIFPGIPFGGSWRYESSGQNALATLPQMMALVQSLQERSGLVPLEMVLVKQERVKGAKRKFTVVQLRLGVTVDQMMLGEGTYQAQLGTGSQPVEITSSSGTTSTTPTIPSTPPPVSSPELGTPIDSGDEIEGDDDIVDAELVDDDEDQGDGNGPMTRAEAFAWVKEHGGSAVKVEGGWGVKP